jgi:hypothetical protein
LNQFCEQFGLCLRECYFFHHAHQFSTSGGLFARGGTRCPFTIFIHDAGSWAVGVDGELACAVEEQLLISRAMRIVPMYLRCFMFSMNINSLLALFMITPSRNPFQVVRWVLEDIFLKVRFFCEAILARV